MLFQIYALYFLQIIQTYALHENLFVTLNAMETVAELLERTISLEKHGCKRDCIKKCLEDSCFGILVNQTNKLDDSCYVCYATEYNEINTDPMNIAEDFTFYLLLRDGIEANASLSFDSNEIDLGTNSIAGSNLNGIMSSVVAYDIVTGKVN